ncbi:hypothetical protein EDB83DRAFT_2656378 [Lactarius deliciosus]|nr:hypothetical protein EDB83DRAFT_2656378 [Lactarius deliciosus]
MVRMLDVARTAEAIKLRTCATHLSASFRLHCDRESCCQEAETDRTNPYRGAQAQVARQQWRSYIYLLRRTTTPLFVQRDVLRRSLHKSIEFLYHGLEQGSPFPPFSEYQDTFSNKLTPDMFAAFAIPLWIPQPQQLLCFAKATYPYWKERRIERGGHCIIPTLNYVELDIKNESYICFRRRDVKAMCKTCASQASSSEKLMRLKQELATAAELVTYPYWKERRIEQRDVKAMRKTRASQASSSEKLMRLKQELATAAELVTYPYWKERRIERRDVKAMRKTRASQASSSEKLMRLKQELATAAELTSVLKREQLTREQGSKQKRRIVGLRLKSRDNNGDLISPTQHHDAVVRPKERAAAILAQVDREMARIKDRDHHWEDGIENAYQPQPVAHAQRHFNGSPHLSQLNRHHHCCRHLRLLLLTTNHPLQNGVPSKYAEVVEVYYVWTSEDNEPSVGNDGPNEKDRALLNEFHPTYLLKGMSLKKTIIQQLTTDPTIYTLSSDGRLLGFCLIGLASPPRFVATPSLLFCVPLSLRPPSRAAAMHQHQQQSAQQGTIGTPQTTRRPFLCSRNVHPAGLPKIRRSKEQIEAEREAGVKALKEKIEAVRMAKEHLAQMNIMEERDEDDLLSTTIHKRRHVDIETDSDECFDLKDVDHGSDEDSSSESDKATKTKTKGKKCVKGAARQELLTRTEELRSVKHSQGQQKAKHDVGGFAAQDLHCKKYANSGLRLRSLTPANAAQLQQPEVADPFELGGLCDDDLKETCPVVAEVKGLQYNPSCGNELVRVGTKTEDIDLGTKPQATCKAPKSKATKVTVKKGASFKSLESPKPFVGLGACPDIAQQCLDDPRWKRVFLPTLSHAFYITDHPFTNWIWESNTLLQTVQIVFNLSFPKISYTLSVQDKVVKAAYDRMKTRRSKIASDVLLLVKTFFEGTEFRNRPERIKEHVRWALRFRGGAYYETPVPKSCTLKPNDPGCPKPDGFLRSQFILPVAKTYVNFAEKSVLHPSLGPRNPPKGLYAMVLTAV